MYEDTLHDLRVKHSETFAGLKLPNESILPFYIHEIFLHEDDIDSEDMDPDDAENIPADYCTFSGEVWHNAENFKQKWRMDVKLRDLVFDYPRMGVAEVGPSAIFGTRMANLGSPLKYRKTPSYESVSTINPSWVEYRKLNMDIGSALLPEFLFASWNNQPYRSIEDAVELLTHGHRLGCALSPQYSIHISWIDDNLRVAREGYYVGVYLPEEKQVFLNSEELLVHREELSEIGFDVSETDFSRIEEVSGDDPFLPDHLGSFGINVNKLFVNEYELDVDFDPDDNPILLDNVFSLESMEA